MRLGTCSLLLFAIAAAACATSKPGSVDASDTPVIDAAPDGVPDAEPCVPDPAGEACNGIDDDCDDSTDEGFPGVGEACAVGVGACVVNGSTVCTSDGTSTECDAVPLPPGTELCGNTIDDDCDDTTDEGFPDLGLACSAGTGACTANGVNVCNATGQATECNATPGTPGVESCNAVDDDCDMQTDEDFQLGTACDGAGDTDLCTEGSWICNGTGGRACTDATGSTTDTCGGGDQDCDPTSADGSEDPQVGTGCDGGGDTDLCVEGVQVCSSGSLSCTDATGSTTDNCGGGDDDCDPASADGSEHPGLGAGCDGGDTDLCSEGVQVCSGTVLACNDATGSTLDLCGGGDQDCDPASADGSEDPGVGTACDGGDSDLCAEGVTSCSAGSISCGDVTGSSVDLCGGGDEDCDPASADGSEHPGLGAGCDGGDTDLCSEGVQVCSGTTLACNDVSGSTVDLCGGGDQDCDPSSADGSEDPLVGAACDGPGDGDLCAEANTVCSGGALICPDGTPTTFELCNGLGQDEDCQGGIDEDWIRDDNPVCASTLFSLGSVSGDTGAGQLTDSWLDEEWDTFTLTEDNSGSLYLSATVELYSPPGTDYDLYLRCVNCTGAIVQSSTVGGLTGHTDTLRVRWGDDFGQDDTAAVVVEIRHWASNVCAYWQLNVYGNTNLDGFPDTCNP